MSIVDDNSCCTITYSSSTTYPVKPESFRNRIINKAIQRRGKEYQMLLRSICGRQEDSGVGDGK